MIKLCCDDQRKLLLNFRKNQHWKTPRKGQTHLAEALKYQHQSTERNEQKNANMQESSTPRFYEASSNL